MGDVFYCSGCGYVGGPNETCCGYCGGEEYEYRRELHSFHECPDGCDRSGLQGDCARIVARLAELGAPLHPNDIGTERIDLELRMWRAHGFDWREHLGVTV